MSTRLRLIAYGELLHGKDWKKPLGRDLGVNERTIKRWSTGEYDVPARVFDDLERLAKSRSKELVGLGRRS